MIRVAVIGASGRMGMEVCAAVEDAPDMSLVAQVNRSGPALSELRTVRPDAVIEFTTAGAIEEIAASLEGLNVAWLSGTTGLGETEMSALRRVASQAPVLWAPNTSIGIGLLRDWVRQATRTLPGEWALEIVETHHPGKLDAPSGTALSLAEVWTEERPGPMAHGRHGMTGPRDSGEIGMHALRVPGAIGEHRLVLSDGVETLELIHRAHRREAFVRGALEGVRWLGQQKAGLYGLDDWVRGRRSLDC